MSTRYVVARLNALPPAVLANGFSELAERADADYYQAVLDTERNVVVGTDGGEPEDQTLARDWDWVAPALNAALAAGAAAERAAIVAWLRQVRGANASGEPLASIATGLSDSVEHCAHLAPGAA
jgi:hypothetical protein